MVIRLCNYASGHLLVALLLSSCLRVCDSTLDEDEENSANENTTRPEVRIPQGIVRGVNMVTHYGRQIFGFRGIPFAEPPVGNLRFKGPMPAETWNGTLDASMESSPCPQFQAPVAIGDEDCLYLRVYTPQFENRGEVVEIKVDMQTVSHLGPTSVRIKLHNLICTQLPESDNFTLLPVIVYIYGGGFNWGSPSSSRNGPYYLLDKDVILVVPSYRIGVLGFLSTGDEVLPGNFGLKDIVQALKWNQDNIRYFGGDPNRVTLVGGSSGGMAVELLAFSNLTNGLFHRYIMQSGTALSPYVLRSKSSYPSRALQVGKYLGCPTNTSSILVECLRDINASELVKSAEKFYLWEELPITMFGPSIEPDIEGALITDAAANLLATGKTRDLPRMVTATLMEGNLHYSYLRNKVDKFDEFLDKIDILLPAILRYDLLVDNVTAYTDALKSYYLNDLTADRNLLLNNISQLEGDSLFKYPTYASLQHYPLRMKSPQYLCSFQYRGTFSHSYKTTGGSLLNLGAVHGDETIYLFQSPSGLYGPPEWKMSENDRKIVDTIVQLWTSFAINGTPTTADPNDGIMWEPYSSSKSHLRIGSDSDISLAIEYNFFEDRAAFWNELTANTSWK